MGNIHNYIIKYLHHILRLILLYVETSNNFLIHSTLDHEKRQERNDKKRQEI